MVSLGVSFILLIEDQGPVEVDLSSACLILICLYCVLGVYHSFKSCALPLSLLFQQREKKISQGHNITTKGHMFPMILMKPG